MLAARLVAALVILLPGLAVAQTAPPAPAVSPAPGAVQTAPGPEISPRTPPPPTVPSSPDIFVSIPVPSGERPRRVFEFHPTAGVSEEFTDNYNRTRKGQSNFRSTVSPGFRLLFDDGFLTGQAAYGLSAFYDTLPGETGVHHNLAGQVAWQATPVFRLGLAEAFTVSDDPARADRLDLRRGRQEFTSNTTSLTADYTLPLLKVGAYYRLGLFSSDDDDTTSHTVGATATTAIGRSNALTGGYEYLTSSTERQSASGSTASTTFGSGTARETEVEGHQFTSTFSRDITSEVAAGLTASYAMRDLTENGRTTDYTRWSLSLFNNYIVADTVVLRGNIGVAQISGGSSSDELLLTSSSSLSYWLGPAVINLAVERGFSETFATSSNGGVVQTLGASASLGYRFTPLFSGSIGGSYRENKTTGIGNSNQNGQSGQDETTIGGNLVLNYQILRWLGSSLEYAYTTTDASGSGRSYSENRVRLSFNALFF